MPQDMAAAEADDTDLLMVVLVLADTQEYHGINIGMPQTAPTNLLKPAQVVAGQAAIYLHTVFL